MMRRVSSSCFALALALLATTAHAAEVKLCVPQALSTTALGACSTTLQSLAAAAGITTDTYSCVSEATPLACTRAVVAGTAHLTKFGGDNLYTAHFDFDLKAVAAENLKSAPFGVPAASYYSVAVVKDTACAANPDLTFADLKGRGVCATGYRRTAGWALPVGSLVASGALPVVSRDAAVEQDAESVVSYFTKVCAVGVSNGGPAKSGETGAEWPQMCTACADKTCADNVEDERYEDYDGALLCLTEGAAELAFTKHDTLLGDPSGWESPTVKQSNLRLLCPNSAGCKPITDWRTCNMGIAATHAFVAKSEWIATPAGTAAINFLGALNETAINSTRRIDPASPNLLFTASAEKTVKLDPNSFSSHFGGSTVEAFRAIRDLAVPTVRVCTRNNEEQASCEKFTPAMNNVGAGVLFTCIKAASGDCLESIKSGESDMHAFDGQDIYQGTRDGLMAIAAEKNPASETVLGVDYYSVAVVRKSWCDSTNGGKPTFNNLKGLRACSTGYRRSAGFTFPLGFMVREGYMPIVRNADNIEDDAESWTSFFSGGVCAARVSNNGPQSTADGKGAPWDKMCTQCGGDCSTSGPYYDYAGAARCIHDGVADVAFTKHTIVQDFAADGRTPAEWSKLAQGEMALLCPQATGGCVPISQAYKCHVGVASAHAVMVRTDFADVDRLKRALNTISKDTTVASLIFDSQTNPDNHVFKYTTSELVPVNVDTAAYLGQSMKVYQGLDILDAGGVPEGANNGGGAVAAARSSGNGGSKLSNGAIAGIAVGAAVGGAILAVGAFIVISRRRAQDKFNSFKDSSSPDSAVAAVKGGNF